MVDEVQRREETQMQVEIDCNTQTEFAKLTAAQKREMEAFVANEDKGRQEIAAKRMHEIEPLEICQKQINMK
jgi:hypothetical protein